MVGRCARCDGCILAREAGCTCDVPTCGCETPTVPFDWTASFRELLQEVMALYLRKMNDYTGGGDPLENYIKSGEIIGVTVEGIMLSRLQEKVTRAGYLLGGTEQMVLDEGVVDTLMDAANLVLLIINELKRKEHATHTD